MPIERTLQQLHSGPGRVEHGHVMYSDDAPQAEGMLASELSNGPFTWGKGVLVRREIQARSLPGTLCALVCSSISHLLCIAAVKEQMWYGACAGFGQLIWLLDHPQRSSLPCTAWKLILSWRVAIISLISYKFMFMYYFKHLSGKLYITVAEGQHDC